MKTVGEMLREVRNRKRLTLDEVERATRIRKKFIVAIEADDFTGMPSLSYAKGFVKNYSEFLGLDTETTMAFFRRQTKDISRSSLLPKGFAEPLNMPFFQLTPGRFLIMIVAGLVCLFLVYFGLQYRRIQLPPKLLIDSPKSDAVAIDKRVDVLGRTDPDATVTINGNNVQVHPDGKFFDQVALQTGLTTITVTATSRYGKSTTLTKTIEYQMQ